MNIVLHVCCGVCAAGAANALMAEGHQVKGYFYNPNIHPSDEYYRRLEAAHLVMKNSGFSLVEGEYNPDEWIKETEALKNEPEGGRRCEICYRLRLKKGYDFMLESGYDGFTSTLTISPHKPATIINNIGISINSERFLVRDFKKKDGFKKAIELAKRWNIYQQRYCGCIYSLGERLSPGE